MLRPGVIKLCLLAAWNEDQAAVQMPPLADKLEPISQIDFIGGS